MKDSLKAMASLLLSLFIVMTGFGLAGYIVPLRALKDGWTVYDISHIGAGYSAGYLLSSVTTPKFIRRAGHIRVFAAYTALLSSAILLCALVPNRDAWMAFRAISGFAIAGCYMIMESWINEKSTNKDRGFMLSAYMVVAMSGTIVGPYIVSYGDVGTSGLFIVSALLFSAAIFPVALSAAPSPSLPTDTSFDLRGLWLRSPVAFVGTLVAGIIAAAWLNFAPAYARLTGLDATGGANLIAAVTIGSILSQFPLGRLSDVMDRRIVMIMCGVVGIAACLWMAMVDASHPAFLYLSAFAAGTVIYPIYTLNVAHANDVAPKGQFVRISSGLSVLYGVGVIIGPLVTGPAISYAGPSGLPLLLAACFAVYAGFAGWRIFRRPV